MLMISQALIILVFKSFIEDDEVDVSDDGNVFPSFLLRILFLMFLMM